MNSLILTSTILLNLYAIPVEVIKDPIPEILEKLAYCESRNNPKALNIRDGGDNSSFGLYQFQMPTFVHFGRRYGLPHDNIWDSAQQHNIAEAMIREGRGAKHWLTCWKKLSFIVK